MTVFVLILVLDDREPTKKPQRILAFATLHDTAHARALIYGLGAAFLPPFPQLPEEHYSDFVFTEGDLGSQTTKSPGLGLKLCIQRTFSPARHVHSGVCRSPQAQVLKKTQSEMYMWVRIKIFKSPNIKHANPIPASL